MNSAQTTTQISLKELLETGKTTASAINKILETKDGERAVRKILVAIGIDPRTELDLQIFIPRYMLDKMLNVVNETTNIIQQKAISNRNILQAIETAKMKGANYDSIDKIILKNGYERIQFNDFKGEIGLVASRKIIDDLAFLVKDIYFGLSMGRYGAKTTVLKEAQGLGRITTDISTYLRFASGLTPNYFNNCWGTSALVYEPKELGIKEAKHNTCEIIWSDVLGIRPTIHEFGYTLGLFDTAMFEILNYFERSPKIYNQLMKLAEENKEIKKMLAEKNKNNLSTVQQISTSVAIDGLRLKEGEIAYQYFLEGKTAVRYILDNEWHPIEKTKEEFGELNQFGEMEINGVLYNSEVSLLAIDWYESAVQTLSPLRFISPLYWIGRIVEKKAERQYLDRLYVKIQQEKVALDKERYQIETARLNSELRLRTEELQQSEEQRRIALEAAMRNEKLAAVGLLGTSFAHEINNPLAAAGTHLRVASALVKKKLDNKTDKIIESLEGAITSIDQAKAVVTNFRSSTTLNENKEYYNLNELCNDALRINQYTKQEYEIKINYTTELPQIYCNKTEIIQLLTNLFNNAFEAMKEQEDRLLTITTTADSEYVILKIQDTGGGITEEYKDKIFTPFFTTKKQESTGTGGTGLGLYRCRKIVEDLKGMITFNNCQYITDKKGAEFEIKIPFTGEVK